MKQQPPKRALRFLRWFCREDYLEEIEGDLFELFEEQSEQSARWAKWRFWWQVLLHFRPDFIKSFKTYPLIASGMFKNYFKVAWRSMLKNSFYSFINIGGLAIGLTCSIMIMLWIQDEYSVDNFHEKDEQLYQVYMRTVRNGDVQASYNTSARLPVYLSENIPEIERASGYAKVLRLSQQGDTYETFRVGDQLQKMQGSRAGTDFFSMFSYPLLQGTPENALQDPSSIAISRKMATLFFGSPAQAFGKTLEVNDEREVTVSAIFEDLPPTASNQFDYLLNWDYWVKNDDFKGNWYHFGTLTFVQLQENADPQVVEEKLLGLLDSPMGIEPDSDFQVELGLQPYGDRYLYSNFENGQPAESRIIYVRLLSFIALFILLIASINFTNLSIANSLGRSLEIGVRKVSGAQKSHLTQQFLVEAFILSFLAVLLACLLVALILPWFNNFTQKQITFPLTLEALLFIFGLTITVGLIAGSYPALFLSSIRINKVLKGQLKFSAKKLSFRKGLIVFQFALAILLIISTIIITQQTSFFQNKDIGYNRENVLYFPIEGTLVNDYLTFKEEVSKMPSIKFVDRSSQTPHNMGFSGPFVNWPGKDEEASIPFVPNSVGYDFLNLMDIKVIEGRNFSESFALDSTSFLVNELAVQQMGLEEPIGTIISVFRKQGPIVGVFENFHTQSLHQAIQPTVLDVKEGLNFGTVMVKTEAGKTQQALASLEKVYTELNPDFPFTYYFLDDEYNNLYNGEQIINKLSNLFGLLAIFISCLGLLGLSVFAAEQRTKEIGIRKVLGASITGIIGLLSKDFLKLVLIALIIASPIAWYIMQQWLDNFAYRIEVKWWVFALTSIIVLAVAFITVSFQSIRVALANPINALKSE